MDNLDVQRLTKFVSLDTHPANNSLVVTYENLVIISDKANGNELTRRSKRDQFQLKILALESMIDNGRIDLNKICDDILSKCPMLVPDQERTVEAIHLNLFYLFNRKRAQSSQLDRPPSSASIRLKSSGSAQQQASGQRHSLSHSDNPRRPSSTIGGRRAMTAIPSDPLYNQYEFYRSKELDENYNSDSIFLREFDEHLIAIENEHKNRHKKPNQNRDLANLDTHLEGLYGDFSERLEAIMFVRGLAREESQLTRAFLHSDNSNLLISAILRTLRDSQHTESYVNKSILYCLIKLSHYGDEFLAHEASNSNDLVRVCVDLLEDSARTLGNLRNLQEASLELLQDQYYKTSSVMVIILNLLSLDFIPQPQTKKTGEQPSIAKKLLTTQIQRIVEILVNFFTLLANHSKFLLGHKSESETRFNYRFLLSRIISLSIIFSPYKELVNCLKLKKYSSLCENIIQLLDFLQTCHPERAETMQVTSNPMHGQNDVLNELYELEIKLINLIANIIYDQRLRARLLKVAYTQGASCLLLKCILRNLVRFLASINQTKSRKQTVHNSLQMSFFHRSEVLLAPLKCLYELSCCDQVKKEIFKSRIILKCLLDFLQLSTLELDKIASPTRLDPERRQPAEDVHQIILDPDRAEHYILALWLNLSARKSLPVYSDEAGTMSDNDTLREALKGYLEQAIDSMSKLANDTSKSNRIDNSKSIDYDRYLLIYLHAKLTRNFVQFLEISTEPLLWHAPFSRWLGKLATCLKQCLSQAKLDRFDLVALMNSLQVECLAIINHLLDKVTICEQLADGSPEEMALIEPLWAVAQALLSRYLSNELNDSENDDLLIVMLQFVANLAKHREICSAIDARFCENILRLSLHIFQNKSTDSEMIVTCSFALDQLLNHSKFLELVEPELTGDDANSSRFGRAQSTSLLTSLGLCVLHGDLRVAKLANLILNKIKSMEERTSLSDSLANTLRFECYNGKWLESIKSNRDNASLVAEAETIELGLDDDEYRGHHDELGQLKALRQGSYSPSRPKSHLKHHESAEDVDYEEGDDHDDYEFDEEIDQPDSDLIDPNTMIDHLNERAKSKPY